MRTGIQSVTSFLVVMVMWVVLPGCGGDGGSDPATVSQPPGNPSPSPTPGGNLPPASGSFGGGQGKILFAEGIELPRSIAEFDLATRQVRTLVNYSQDYILKRVVGGVSRANDGSFVVVRNPGPGASAVILHYQADGTRLHEWTVPKQLTPGVPNLFGLAESPRNAFNEGGALSPDGKSIALAEITVGGDRLEVAILDVQSGTWVFNDLLRANDDPPNKTTMNPSTLWSPTGELYVLSTVGLHKVDRVTGVGTLVHPVPLHSPHAPIMSSDGRTIYFEQLYGNPLGGTIWSMDVASGEPTRRSMRSIFGGQYSPTLSPNGEWLLMQEANLIGSVFAPAPIFTPNPLIGAKATPLNISAIRLSETPIDTQNLNIWILDAAGQFHPANGRMAWY
ncbi:MAG: hypothetical protein IPP12_04610 [Nitrospira sp.]|nr:hypothetical protein [Nitrospira sp.]